MRVAILAATVALAFTPSAGRAQWAVVCPTCASEVAQVGSWAKQAADMVRQLAQMRQQYQMLVSTYNALSHATDVFQVAGIVGGVTRSYMPDAADAMSMFAGLGSGGSPSLYGAANSLMAISRYADRMDGTPEGEEMARRERATANYRAVGFAGMQQAQQSILRLDGLIAWITGSPDVTAVAAGSAAIAAEQQNIAHHQAQIAQTQLILMTENRVDQQRAEQRKFEGANALVEATQPLSGSLR